MFENRCGGLDLAQLIDRAITRLRTYTRSNRKLKFQRFLAALPERRSPLRIIDIGGTAAFWMNWWGMTEADDTHITLVNDHVQDSNDSDVPDVPFLESWRIDALRLSKADLAQFDVAFSNSCIEHLVSWDDQVRLARWIAESGKAYFVQVPNKYAPIDPHYPRPYVPFFACYPKPVQRRLLTISALGSGGRQTMASAAEVLKYYNPLGFNDMRRLFPDAEISVEKPFGVPMSILAQRIQGHGAGLAADAGDASLVVAGSR
jgi:hypothetical protein